MLFAFLYSPVITLTRRKDMKNGRIGILFSAATILLVSACTIYFANSEVSFEPTKIVASGNNKIMSNDSLQDRKHVALCSVSANVKKLTLFHKNPTKEQVDIILAEKAKRLGADAIVNVTYKLKTGLSSWGILNASGTAIRFTDA